MRLFKFLIAALLLPGLNLSAVEPVVTIGGFTKPVNSTTTYLDVSGNPVPVTALTPLPTTGGGGGGAGDASAANQVLTNGKLDALILQLPSSRGIKTSALSLSVAPSSDGVFPVTGTFWQATQPVSGTFWQATQPVSIATAPVLVAGSAIIGKVGIDQTTPGTTNLVALAANQSVNTAQINGVTPLMGAGNTGTGSPRVTIASDQAAIPVTPAATEVHLGQVGGTTVRQAAAPTVTASSAYATGNQVGTKLTLSNAARVASGSGVIQSVILNSKSAQTAQFDVIFFSSDPTTTVFTDKTAVAVAVADFDKVLGVAHITDWTAMGTTSVGTLTGVGLPFALPSGTAIYAMIVVRGTPTFTATTDLSLSVRILQD